MRDILFVSTVLLTLGNSCLFAESTMVLVEPQVRIDHVAYSPRGTRVATLSELSLKVWGVDSLILLGEFDRVLEFTFLTDLHLVLLKPEKLGVVVLSVVDVDSSEVIDSCPLAAPPGAMRSRLARSPDGATAAFVCGDSAYVYDSKKSKLTNLAVRSPQGVYFDRQGALVVLGGEGVPAAGTLASVVHVNSKDLKKMGVVKRVFPLDERLVLLEGGITLIADVMTGEQTEFEKLWYVSRKAAGYCFGLDEQTGHIVRVDRGSQVLCIVNPSDFNLQEGVEYRPSWTPVSVDYFHSGRIVAIGDDNGVLRVVRIE